MMSRRPAKSAVVAVLIAAWAACVPAGEAPAPDGPETPKSGYQAFLEKGRIRDFPERPWEQAFAYRSICYNVRTNTSADVAEYAGVLMDAVHFYYCARFGVQGTGRANINIFRDKAEMDAFGTKRYQYSSPANSNGFFTTGDGGTICTFWQEFHGMRPEVVLMHEGSHQFSFAVFRGALPTWLDEGFAVYFENSRFDGHDLDMGRVPLGRLQQLQAQMKKDQHVTLEKLFATAQKDFGIDHYGAAWAFVYWLAHGGDAREMALHQQALGQFVADCRANRKDGKRLAGYLGRAGLSDLEKEWKQWVLELDPADPYGGVRLPDPKQIDAEGGAALRRFSEYYAGLRSAKVEFSIAAGAGPGEAASGSLAVRRPNLLSARLAGDKSETILACDGKTLLVATTKGAPARTEAPATLDAALGSSAPAGEVFNSCGLGPLAALFRANPHGLLLGGAEAVSSLGLEDLAGTKCRHLKIAGRKADRELWIAEGDRPLLLKALIYAPQPKSAGGKPGARQTVVITFKDWAPNAELPDKVFALPAEK
jgi:hypothetical protein